MDIVYATDEKYASHAAAGICSVFENHRSEDKVRVFVLGNGLSEETAKKLKDIGLVYRVAAKLDLKKTGSPAPPDFAREVSVLDTGSFDARLDKLAGGKAGTGYLSAATFIRIYASDFLPGDVGKYLYLDSDTVVTGSLRELFETDLKGMPAGMAPEPTIYPELKKSLGINSDEPYFNAGMILFDREKWDGGGLEEKCSQYLRENNSSLDFLDQDILNAVLRGHIRALPQKYNFFSNYHYRSYNSLVRYSPWYSLVMSRGEYDEARRGPAVIHFAGDERPWYRGSKNPFRDEYRKYLELSPWCGEKPEEGHEVYMLMYHLMNLVTRICPGARDIISRYYFRRRFRSA